jgi:AraC family transcriptional regulator, regulatory protein of adaptative response / methylated-DNA-[protein]-cysteine methyltransferase
MEPAASRVYLPVMKMRNEAAHEAQALPDPESAWAAVLGRDAGFDGRFVYAVSSTGVYCRPSCASRRPRRERVTFWPGPAAAEAAGYRACRRCQPSQPGPDEATRRVQRAVEYIDAHLDEAVTLERLGEAVGLSPAHLQRVFKRATGMSPKAYLRARRVERFKDRLRKGDSVTTATYDAGYGSGSRVYEQSDAVLGMTPATYGKGGLGMRIRYAIVSSPLGRLLVGATGRGVCAVALGDDDRRLEAELRREYPRAELEAAGGELGSWVESVLAVVAGGRASSAVPLDVQATSFQWAVWRALQAIPAGATRSYGEVAAAIGRPGSARAVARACASNRVALLVPCHRVVREDGALGGYRWGTARKQRLLDRERGGQE